LSLSFPSLFGVWHALEFSEVDPLQISHELPHFPLSKLSGFFTEADKQLALRKRN
jgi:hypothetical protein